ncbi:MAG: hypothetical protein ACLQGP_36845 [Isosphaeraceae bacterium]
MPGYTMQPDGSLGYGARKPLPGNVLSRKPLAPHLAALASREQARQAQGSIRGPAVSPVPNSWSNSLAGNPMLRRPGEGFMGNEYRELHPSGGMDSSPGRPGLYGVSGAGMYNRGLVDARHRQQLGLDLDNEQVNHRLGINAAMAGRPAPAFGQYVGGSHPDQGMALAHARAFPSSTGQDVDHLVNAHLQGLGIASTAPKVGAIVGGQVGSAIPSAGIAGQSRPPVAIPTPPELPSGLMNQLMASVGAQANARTLPGGTLDYSNGAPSEITAPVEPRLAGPELAPGQTPEMLAALPLQTRFHPRSMPGADAYSGRPRIGSSGSFQVQPGVGPQLDGSTGASSADPLAAHAASVERERAHTVNGNFAGAEAEQNYRRGIQEQAALRQQIAQSRMAEDAAKLGTLPNLVARGVESGIATPDQVRAEQEKERRLAIVTGMAPDWRTHFRPDSNPTAALAEYLAHGHSDAFMADPMGREASALRGVLGDTFGPAAVVEGARSPWPWSADDERSARMRAFLGGTPYRPAVPTPGRTVAIPRPPAVPVPRPPARSGVARFLDTMIGRPRITFE